VTDPLDALFEGRGPTLEVAEVAELLGLTKQSVYNWLRDGTIPGYKVGTVWVVLRDGLKDEMRRGFNRNAQRRTDAPTEGEEGA
jgi:excisionase family DNA binding protein